MFAANRSLHGMPASVGLVLAAMACSAPSGETAPLDAGLSTEGSGDAAPEAARDGGPAEVSTSLPPIVTPGATAMLRPDAGALDAALPVDAGHRDVQRDAALDGAVDAAPDASDGGGVIIVLPDDGSVPVPTEGFYVELAWHTPADPDESDEGPSAGADVDLHLASELAMSGHDGDGDGSDDPWFAPTFDCYWFNANPDWGIAGQSLDNPALDRDDTDGAGPELIGLRQPEDGRSYRIAVHYWEDHGYGRSHATVRVYVRGELAAELLDTPLSHLDLWEVASVEWPSGEVTPLGTADAPRIVANYAHPSFTPP